MRFHKIPCNDKEQALWAQYYIAVAKGLCDTFGVSGRAAVRDAIRMYADIMGKARLEFLMEHRQKPHLENLFFNGGPLPCGFGCTKEWIKTTPQEVFVNIVRCPYADCWNQAGESELGKMFCEEYYPAYIFAAASDKAQINIGRELVNEGDTYCRLSVYLRPANLSEASRGFFFEEFDCTYEKPDCRLPVQPIDYINNIHILHECCVRCAALHIGEEGTELVNNISKY